MATTAPLLRLLTLSMQSHWGISGQSVRLVCIVRFIPFPRIIVKKTKVTVVEVPILSFERSIEFAANALTP